MSCQPFTNAGSSCSCLLNLQVGTTILALNLRDAVVYPLNTGPAGSFRIQTPMGGANVDPANLSMASVETLICNCIAGT